MLEVSKKLTETARPKMPSSEYEEARARTIASNEAKLRELGLFEEKLIPRKQKPKPTRQPKQDPDYAPASRRTTRVSGSKRPRGGLVELADSGGDESSSDEDEFTPSTQTRRSRQKSRAAATPAKREKPLPPPASGSCIVIEPAKTGRSKCRQCLEVLAQDELRVGMESWIMGRQAMVWQHPRCFWSNLQVTIETSGRTKCKQTKVGFSVGESRISASAHTTTSHFKLAAAASLLRPLVAAAPKECDPATIGDVDTLVADEREAFLKGLVAPESAVVKEEELVADADQGDAKQNDGGQPSVGSVTRAEGRVCWLFAGAKCYGTLLPKSETKSHCYARTHKGNTKTLKKGTDSWWVLE